MTYPHSDNFPRHGRTLAESDFQIGIGNLHHGGVLRANALMDRQEMCNEMMLGVMLDLLDPLINQEILIAPPIRIAKLKKTGCILSVIECKIFLKNVPPKHNKHISKPYFCFFL